MMRFYAPIQKAEQQDDGSLIVTGVATDETVDVDGEIVRYTASKTAFEEWDARNIREMHQPIAVGTAIDVMPDDATKSVALRVRISAGAPNTQAKVLDGTLKGFSIGGRVGEGGRKVATVDGEEVVEITRLSLSEVSLVDVPANPNARIQLAKVSDSGDIEYQPLQEATMAEQITIADVIVKGALSDRLNSLIDERAETREERAELVDRLASAAGIDDGTVNQILDGEIEVPPRDRLRGFAEVLDVSLDSLVELIPDDRQDEVEEGDMPEDEKAGPMMDEEEEKADEPTTEKLGPREAEMLMEILGNHVQMAISEFMEAVGPDAPIADDEIVEEAEKSEQPTDVAKSVVDHEELAKRTSDTIEKSITGLAEKFEKSLGELTDRIDRIEAQPVLDDVAVNRPVEKSLSGAREHLAGLGITEPTDRLLKGVAAIINSVPDGGSISKGDLGAKVALLMAAQR